MADGGKWDHETSLRRHKVKRARRETTPGSKTQADVAGHARLKRMGSFSEWASWERRDGFRMFGPVLVFATLEREKVRGEFAYSA